MNAKINSAKKYLYPFLFLVAVFLFAGFYWLQAGTDKKVILIVTKDQGLVGVPETLIFKAGPLTAEEWDVIKQHPEKGHRIALSSPDLADIGEL